MTEGRWTQERWLLSSQHLDRIEAAVSRCDLESRLGGLCDVLGVEYFSYVVSQPSRAAESPASSPLLLTNYPQEWQTRYRSRSYHKRDPVVANGSRTRRPFFWNEPDYLRRFMVTVGRMTAESREFGIVSGLTVPVHGPLGEWGLFSVASGRPPCDLQRDLGANQMMLELLAARVHAVVVERILGDTAPPPASLTDNERTCLSWTLRGKTAWEISRILGRSKSTVDYHVQMASKKLGASNKAHAAFMALQAGLL